MTAERGAFARIGAIADEWWPSLATFVGTVVLTLESHFLPQDLRTVHLTDLGTLIFSGGAAAFFLGGLKQLAQGAENRRLREDNEALQEQVDSSKTYFFKKWHDFLAECSKRLDFGPDERISIYKCDGDEFLMLGRYSRRPEYSQTGRGHYPVGQGCIGKAYSSGEYFVDDLPERKEEWIRRMIADYGYKRDRLEKMKMRPRSYAGFAIRSESGNDNEGAIVFESTKPKGLDFEALRRFFQEREPDINRLRSELRSQEPSLALSKGEGV